ncbi:MAG: PAS domain S-box protein [Ignavibacteriaceae bacterium]|nr:PAS domain S-box protein [Ignavibacteriaceae bacterium]
MNKLYLLHKLSRAFSKFIRIKRWQLILYLFIITEAMAFSLNFIQSYLWWGYINVELLYIGSIDAAIIVIVLGPALVYLVSQITRFEEYKKEAQAEQKFRHYIENSLDIVTVLDKNGFIKYESPSIEKMLGYHPNEMIGKNVFDFTHPDERDYLYKLFTEKISEYNSYVTVELRFLKRNGTWAILSVSGRNLLHNELVDGIVLNSRDISELKESQTKLSFLLEEKKLLIKEIHHRVKNNFQSVSSMLFLQASMQTDEKLQEILNVSRNRIHSLAIIHQKLQETEDVSNVNLMVYFEKLIENLKESYLVENQNIKINFNMSQDVLLPVNQAVHLGLIFNELISNVFKYAFPDNREGEITIQFKVEKGMNYLIVKDNGIGLPANFDISNSSSLGLKIIESMSKQLHGEFNYSSSAGTEFILSFPQVELSN